jgi:hypothetical protein
MLGATPAIYTRVREGESELRVSIGDEDVVLASVVSFAQAGLSQGPQPKSQSPLLKRTSVSPVSSSWVSWLPAPAWPTSWPDQKSVRSRRDPSQMCYSVTSTQAGADG